MLMANNIPPTNNRVRSSLTDRIRRGQSVNTIVEFRNTGIEVGVDGYGDKNSDTGLGRPIFIEYENGKLMLYVWADINQEDPTHVIDMSESLEVNRREDSRS